jgi:RNA polymerase sigma-70 factor (ECF subfamily)
MRADHGQRRLRGSETLIQQCLAGDAAAWNDVVGIYFRRVLNLAYRFSGNYDDAQDLTQEVFIKLFKALDTYDRRSNFHSWMMSVCRNLCIDHYRRRRREEERVTREVDPDSLVSDAPIARPETELERQDQVALVRAALVRLGPTVRTAVILRDIHELSYQEIAQRLNLPEGTVKSRINRGRLELGRHLRHLRSTGVGDVKMPTADVV